nr:bifunctional diguanylate cyclase/phosphodiesterase [uncultured Sphingomonas sp.]
MSAVANRAAAPSGARVADQYEVTSLRPSAADTAILDALPIAAGVFGLRKGKLWVHALNEKFLTMAGCMGATDRFIEQFRHHGEGTAGTFISTFLQQPCGAADELDYADGEGVARNFFRLKVAPLTPDDGGNPRCLLSVVDRTVEVQAENHLRAEMLRDSLTGLPNRLSFTETVENAADASDEEGYAVLVVDMLRFSRINESMGSMAGDELIITFARRMKSTLRKGDVLARTGGNEFGILVKLSHGVDDALAAAERIQNAITDPFRLSELEIKVECAIGVALLKSSQEAEELFRHAQFAVKQAKQAGRPQIYQASEASAARRRFSIETELRRALDTDQLRLSYQPLIDLKSGKVAGYEALARWRHPDRGEVSPSEFIPVAEESGLILHLGRWAMDQAAQTMAEWDRRAGQELPLYVGVNLSAIQVARDNIADVVESALRSSGLRGNRLTLELTESSIVQDPGRATRVFEALKSLDATVAMDDFGTGYSSLAYLQRLPIDVLKIDRSFVTGMMRDADAVAIVRAVLSLADALGMKTTAEGIESVELATTLAMLGCSSGQGFYFARPLEADAAFDYWNSRAS